MEYPSNDDGRDRRFMEAGDLAPLIAEFTRQLSQQGYADLTVRGYDDAARHLAHWLAKSGVAVAEIDEAVVRRFSRHRCRCPGMRRQKQLSGRYVRRACRFVAFLAKRGIVAQTKPETSAADHHVVAFQDWLRRHRGLSERTIELHGYLLMQMLPALRPRQRSWDAQHIREVIIAKTKQVSGAQVKKLASTLRGYVRFLSANGRCRAGLEHAVPIIAQWRLILAFLEHLETKRGNAARTRNARLAAINAFFRFLEYRVPSCLDQSRRIHAIPAKKTDQALIGYLARDELQALLEAPDLTPASCIPEEARLRDHGGAGHLQ